MKRKNHQFGAELRACVRPWRWLRHRYCQFPPVWEDDYQTGVLAQELIDEYGLLPQAILRRAIADYYLRTDARNLASFLYLLRGTYSASYQKIVKTIRLVAPFFGDFYLRPSPQNKDVIELKWFEQGQDVPFKAHLLSDGTLRFMCLATVFLQPEDFQPETILVDEPELGLHPYAIAKRCRKAADRYSGIIDTYCQKTSDYFNPVRGTA